MRFKQLDPKMSYVTGADSRSTDSFAGANTIRAMPITTSTRDQPRKILPCH